MKKMSLKIATESLSREEMRMITGGSGGGQCYLNCSNWMEGRYMAVPNCSQVVINMYCQPPGGSCQCN